MCVRCTIQKSKSDFGSWGKSRFFLSYALFSVCVLNWLGEIGHNRPALLWADIVRRRTNAVNVDSMDLYALYRKAIIFNCLWAEFSMDLSTGCYVFEGVYFELMICYGSIAGIGRELLKPWKSKSTSEIYSVAAHSHHRKMITGTLERDTLYIFMSSTNKCNKLNFIFIDKYSFNTA